MLGNDTDGSATKNPSNPEYTSIDTSPTITDPVRMAGRPVIGP
ncbi:hypothetical protein [Gordonia sp. (in: high G+C Gram-positive bacteria)]